MSRHSRENGNPVLFMQLPVPWIPAFAGMTMFNETIKFQPWNYL